MKQFYSCALDPITQSTLKLYLFRNVDNVDVIKENIRTGAWKCAAIKSSLILDLFQLVVAANRAAVAQTLGNMVTRSVYGEILYNLSLTRNISQSLALFGADGNSPLLLCFLTTAMTDHSEDIVKQVKGDACPVSNLPEFSDIKLIKDVYKLKNFECDVDILDNIISRMVTKNFVSIADVSM
ncbi:unnamed protein product [Leptosia nina]|uniref:Uncharacterized protein n=1 Tax=Leptosia nina TaxID=320188 RepID=A0AAV1JBY4_9NEOP